MTKDQESQRNFQQVVLHRSQFYPGLVEQRAMEAGARIIFTGLEEDLPPGDTHKKAYFATDTGKLFLWNGSVWLSVTLS